MNAFFFFNFLRVLFYVPAFKKMAESRSSLDSHSLFTWFCWIFANFTTGLVFYVDKGVMDSPVWLNLANAAMCCVGFGLIAWKRWRYSGVSESQATIDAVGDVEGDV